MSDLIGVLSPARAFDSSFLKRQALIFRRLAIPGVAALRDADIATDLIDAYDWLLTRDIVFEPEKPLPIQWREIMSRFSDHQVMKAIKAVDIGHAEIARIEGILSEHGIESDEETHDTIEIFMDLFLKGEYLLRPLSAYLREHTNLDAYPVLAVDEINDDPAAKTDILNIVINAMPVPGGSVGWEQIEEYRGDPDTSGKFLALRQWMNEIARDKLSRNEVKQKLEWLLYNYEQHLRLHRMKVETTTLETIVVTTAELIENVAKLNLGKAAKGLFSIRHRRIDLLQGELTAPGSEIAYISKSRAIFGRH